ncbi:LysR family transcriptional regulator [Clostridiales bacterium FE2011]|nr:LysR family transcriptional regulator [Clostridiales bacterium FE2011]QTE75814.1 LysR family transcriptional regulator [Clostridiales bacterium FE2010]
MTIQQLNYVITISEKGSLNKAAEVLYVTQPSLTSAVRELEKELGITLFNRGGKGVTLTNDGAEFIQYARQVVNQYDRLLEKYGKGGNLRKKFGISCQHYSFAVKSFVEMVKHFDTDEYEFAIRESKTRDVIEDVTTGKSEVGILYLSDFNRKAIGKFLKSSQLEFHPLIKCEPYVYLWKGHPLAKQKSIRLEELRDYPCLSFEQGPSGAFYFAEEILSTYDYIRTIKATDRATMLNLMVGLNGYTLCSGIICEELNGSDYVAVAFEDKEEEVAAGRMEIGYIVKQNMILSQMAEMYIAELKKYLQSIKTEN